METKPETPAGRSQALQAVAFLFVVAAAVTFGWVVGRGGKTEAFAGQEKATAPAVVTPEVSSPAVSEQTVESVPVRNEERDEVPAAKNRSLEDQKTPATAPGDGAAKEKPKVDLAEVKTTRGEGAIIRWSGPAATALRLLDQDKPQDVLEWVKGASCDAAVCANLNGRALLATKDVAGWS